MTSASTRSTGPSSVPERRGLSAPFTRLGPYAAILLGVLAVILIWIGAAAHIAREYTQDERAALQNANNLARAFEEQVIRTLRAADQALLYVRDSYEQKGQIDVALWAKPYSSLSDFAIQIALIDRDGRLAASNLDASDVVDLGDREHFLVHRQRDTDELFISKPLIGRVSGRQSLQLSRRVRARDGSFGGVMVLSVDPDVFVRFYEKIDLGPKGSITLIGTDGVVRAHGTNERARLGESIGGGRTLAEFAKASSGSFRAVSRADGIERLVTYRGVQGYPLIVSVDLAVDDVFAFFHRTRLLRLLAAGFLTLVIGPLILMIIRYERGLTRARDAAEAGSRSRSEFLAVMSHEIRTPLNAVLGFASVLLDSKLDAEQRRVATALHESGDNLLRILNDILDFSRLESGRVELEAIPFSPGAIAEGAANIARPGAAAKGLVLRVAADPDVPVALKGDPGRLRQVLLNLLTNAVKFTNHGEIVLSLRCCARTSEGATIEWSVSDTGIGIAPDRIDGVFSDFVQADSSVNRRFGGSGLGLAICRRIVDQMNGAIGVTSELGKGSRFTVTVTLPFGVIPADTDTAASNTADELRTRIAALGRPLRLLLAEDNPTNQLVGRQMLRDFDINVSVAANGTEAVRAVGEFSYDLVLMDMQMPEMNGIQATREIRARFGPALPIVALTANAYPEDVRACLDAGMNSFVAKPVRKRALIEAILTALHRVSTAPTPPAAAPSGEIRDTLVDPSVIEEFIAEVGADAASQMLTTYLSETERRLAILRNLAGDQRDAIHLEAHTLKGSSGIFGLPRLSAAARELEQATAAMTADEYAAMRAGLETTYTASKAALLDHLEKTRRSVAPAYASG
jgi:signal transduction histidine kinase/CheY-like chemotaxis protein/HPt (histidine-containing phosphotransfer) domain-containing protein